MKKAVENPLNFEKDIRNEILGKSKFKK